VPFVTMWAKKYGTAGQTTDDKKIRHMRIACWIPMTTNTHSEYVIVIAFFHGSNGYTEATPFSIIRT